MNLLLPKITERRKLRVTRAGGVVDWQIEEFDDGRSYMLTVTTPGGVGFSTHFTGEQWSEFQGLIAGAA